MEPTEWKGEQQLSENEKRGRLLQEREKASSKNAGGTKADRRGRSNDNRVDQHLCSRARAAATTMVVLIIFTKTTLLPRTTATRTLLLFRRKLLSGKILGQTTVLVQPDDIMSAIIKRLQGEESDVESLGHAHSNALTFSSTEVAALKNGDLQIVFSLRHVTGAKLKDTSSRVQAEKILSLSNIRPLVVDILTEKRPEGEKLTLY